MLIGYLLMVIDLKMLHHCFLQQPLVVMVKIVSHFTENLYFLRVGNLMGGPLVMTKPMPKPKLQPKPKALTY